MTDQYVFSATERDEPVTAAGRALIESFHLMPEGRKRLREGILAIEREAAALAAERAIGAEVLDVERLHRAVCLSGWVGRGQMDAWHRGPEGEWPCQDPIRCPAVDRAMIDSTPNLRAHHLRTAILHNSETKIERSRLAELERKERAHDAYVRATRKMAEADTVAAAFEQKDYILGWRECLHKFAELILQEDA